MPFILSASILSADFGHLADQIHQAETGGVDWIHVDVMDGSFVPPITMGSFIVDACRKITRLPLDVHLMVDKPERQLESFAHSGAHTLSVHVETCPHLYRTLQTIRELKCHAGVVLNPGTPPEAISSVLHLVDLVLVMTVNPGASGQVFMAEMLPKIRSIRNMLDTANLEALIEVDGGITPDTLPLVYQAGARACVAATAIFKNPDGISSGIQKLRASVAG
jgi:ribulose-phosphate 3-epimerase